MASIETTRFGTLEIDEKEILTFSLGLIGFTGGTHFVLIAHPGGGAFQWLQSTDDGNLAFLVCDPMLFLENYQVQINADDLKAIALDDVSDGIVLTVLSVPQGDPRGMTANLLGPIVINQDKRLGFQLVLNNTDYPTRFPIFGQEQPKEEGTC